MNRHTILDLRPTLQLPESEEGSLLHFQNNTLRPILKFQNDAFVAFISTLPDLKDALHQCKGQDELARVLRQLISPSNLKHQLVGMTLGLMSEEEIKFFKNNEHECSKRCFHMIVDRIAENLFRYR